MIIMSHLKLFPQIHKIKCQVRFNSTNDNVNSFLNNRNPRNLERMRIAYKPKGYHLEKPGRSFWHKLNITASDRYVTARVLHFENGSVLEASTSEWALKKHLYQTTDTSAYINLARVFAQRCLEAGLTELRCDLKPPPEGKLAKFLDVLEKNGVALIEPDQVMPHRPWDLDRPEKPWEVIE